MTISTWKKGRGQWTVNVGLYCCTICKPNSYDPLKMYWWEINGPARQMCGAGSDLETAKRMVQEALAECMKKDHGDSK